MQMTLDDDFNVPDSKPDVEKLTSTRGEVELTEVEALTGKVRVRGICHFYALYATNMERYPVSSLDGQLPFEQILNCDGIVPNDNVKVKTSLEDLTISIINSRKLSIRCLILLKATVCDNQSLDATIDVTSEPASSTMPTIEPQIECLYDTLNMTTLRVNKKDIFRTKEELTVPASKPAIYEILWSSSNLRNVELRLIDGAIVLNGDLAVFLLYSSDDSDSPIQFLDAELAFKGEVPCEDCTPEMIDCIELKIATTQYAVKPDNEGEERLLEIDCTLDLDIKIYEDEQVTLLADIYSPNAECEVVQTPFAYARLLQKNNAKTRVTQKMKLKDAKENIMQICHIDGAVKIDEMTIVDDGIAVEGVITADILFVSHSDSHPLGSTSILVPYRYLIEMDGILPQDTYEVTANLDQITINMVDSDEVEVKAILSLSAIAFKSLTATAIGDISTMPLDAEKMQNQPGMIGTIVKSGDTLWSIAKTYYTTMDSIRACNELESDTIQAGDKLIIVK
jgi:hypothetical protein